MPSKGRHPMSVHDAIRRFCAGELVRGRVLPPFVLESFLVTLRTYGFKHSIIKVTNGKSKVRK